MYFAQNAAYFPFNSWLSFQRLCRLYGDVGYEYCSSGAPRSVIEYWLPFMCMYTGWWRGTVVERRSLTGELSLSCARPAADG